MFFAMSLPSWCVSVAVQEVASVNFILPTNFQSCDGDSGAWDGLGFASEVLPQLPPPPLLAPILSLTGGTIPAAAMWDTGEARSPAEAHRIPCCMG